MSRRRIDQVAPAASKEDAEAEQTSKKPRSDSAAPTAAASAATPAASVITATEAAAAHPRQDPLPAYTAGDRRDAPAPLFVSLPLNPQDPLVASAATMAGAIPLAAGHVRVLGVLPNNNGTAVCALHLGDVCIDPAQPDFAQQQRMQVAELVSQFPPHALIEVLLQECVLVPLSELASNEAQKRLPWPLLPRLALPQLAELAPTAGASYLLVPSVCLPERRRARPSTSCTPSCELSRRRFLLVLLSVKAPRLHPSLQRERPLPPPRPRRP